MAQIITTGSAIVLKSGVKLETLQKLLKYRPSALEKRDDKERLVFKVAVAGDGEGTIADKAIYFAPVTHDENGLATVTLSIPASVKNVKEYAADLLGAAYASLTSIEGNIATASTEVDKAKDEMMKNIISK